MQVFVALVCLLPSLSLWAADGQPENHIDLLGDPDRYNDKRQNYGVCCNGRRRAGKRSFNAESRLLKLLQYALQQPRVRQEEESLLEREVNLGDRHCCKTPNQLPPGHRVGREFESDQLQKEIMWKALLSQEHSNSETDDVMKRGPVPVGVSFGG
ncbi:uncharacterized protein LOC124260572 [Haliotis rubra]|uniref:uncharacterized protein LOC124260572 n=1 Tax=Haliotis rubra TaxID=36100 RepID=UPI001EE612AF|nr:uncharacterized protein LOC124260572 [Haliotis rubra]